MRIFCVDAGQNVKKVIPFWWEFLKELNVQFFHYLFENHPGESVASRVDERCVGIQLPVGNSACFSLQCVLPVDARDQRVLVVIDGEPLWESIPKAGDEVYSVKIAELATSVEHLRTPRFGVPWYRMEDKAGKQVAKLDLVRHFLLIPAGNFVFRRVRDKRSLGPMYVFGEVRKSENGPLVVWRNTTY